MFWCIMNSTNCFSKFSAIFFLVALISGCLEEPVTLLRVGEKAPPFTLDLLDDKQINLDLYTEKPLVVTFMSSWCPCSNDSIPLIKKAYRNNKDSSLQFLMVGMQDAEGKFEKFVERWEVPFPAGFDQSGAISRDYGVSAPPTTVFIDKKGNISRVFYGNIAEKPVEFRQWIEDVL